MNPVSAFPPFADVGFASVPLLACRLAPTGLFLADAVPPTSTRRGAKSFACRSVSVRAAGGGTWNWPVQFKRLLLDRETATPAEIARLAAYTPRTAEDTLRDLAAGDFIIRHRQGRAMTCRLRPEAWKHLLDGDAGKFPRWVDWPGTFAALTGILAVLDRPAANPLLLASELRQATLGHTAALLTLGITAGEHDHGAAFATKLLADLHRALGKTSA